LPSALRQLLNEEATYVIFEKLRPLPAITGALWLIAASGSSSAAPAPSAQIQIKDFMFRPMSLTVEAGATVTWANMDEEPHTVISDTGLFRSGAVDTKETFSFKFDKPGTYRFTCSIHPKMVGTITVK
jgi:plastocyanin